MTVEVSTFNCSYKFCIGVTLSDNVTKLACKQYSLIIEFPKFACNVIFSSSIAGKILIVIITDVNECLNDNGMCSHTCVNTPGSYHCECPADYTLQPDNHNCTEGEYS